MPQLLYLQGKSPRIGGWVGPTTGLDVVVKRKIPISAPSWKLSECWSSSLQLSLHADWATLGPHFYVYIVKYT